MSTPIQQTLLDWAPVPVPSCQLAESPRYAHNTWAWVDITGRTLYTFKHQRLRTLPLPDEIGCIIPHTKPDDYWALGRAGMWLIEGNQIQLKIQAPFDSSTHRFNDGRADALGRIWVSTLVDARKPASGALYCIQKGQVHTKASGLIVGNGLAFSPHSDYLYLADTRQRCVWRYLFDCTSATLGTRELLYEYTHKTERPDGAVCTQDGSYWVAVYEGYRIDRFSPSGTLIEQLPLPLARPTMPCFGGPDLQNLWVCSAQPSEDFPNHPSFTDCSLIQTQTHWRGLHEAIGI